MPHSTQELSMPAVRYGWIGLGRMGLPMCLHLRKQMPPTAKLVICDINSDRIDAFLHDAKSLGPVEVAQSPREVVEKSDVIITSLPPATPYFQVFVDDPSNSVLSAGISDRSKLIIETSTVDVHTFLSVSKKITSSGFGDFIDCPVSGGMIYAEKGELSAMVGGSKELFDRIHPILLTFAAEKSIYHCGPPGSGLAAKIINNYVASVSYVALCEGMNTGVRFGLDPKVLTGVINASSGMSWNSLHMCPVKGVQATSSASRDFKGGPDGGPGFDFAEESTEMTVALMEQVNAKSVCAPLMKDIWHRAMNSPLCEGKEYRSLYKLFSEEDGRAIDNSKTTS